MDGNGLGQCLVDRLSQFDNEQRLRFYEALASRLTVVNRTIWSDEESGSEAKVERLKNVNEILHRVVQAIPTIRVTPREWSDEVMVGEIRRWIALDSSIAGNVGWAIQTSEEWALTPDERQSRAKPNPPSNSPQSSRTCGQGELNSTMQVIIKLDTGPIIDWETFHDVFQEVFGFPGFYGRNMSAWIDCMTCLDDPSAETGKVHVPAEGIVTLQIEHTDDFARRCPEQYEAIIECAAFVNWRRIENGDPAILALSFVRNR